MEEENGEFSSLKEIFENRDPAEIDVDDFDFGLQDKLKIGNNWTKKNLREILTYLKCTLSFV